MNHDKHIEFVKAMQRRGYILDASGGFSRIPNDLHDLVRESEDWPDFGTEAEPEQELDVVILRAGPGDTIVITPKHAMTRNSVYELENRARQLMPDYHVVVLPEANITAVVTPEAGAK